MARAAIGINQWARLVMPLKYPALHVDRPVQHPIPVQSLGDLLRWP